jgi:hypothetical protein
VALIALYTVILAVYRSLIKIIKNCCEISAPTEKEAIAPSGEIASFEISY